jgi:hypothetical protein
MGFRECVELADPRGLGLSRQRLAPEWGSGGVYSLAAPRWGVFYVLSFEGLAVSASCTEGERGIAVASIAELAGLKGGRSVGGDTYNARTLVDSRVFFAGWAHFAGEEDLRSVAATRRLSFSSKYSYFAVWDGDEMEGWVAWMDGPGRGGEWPGEVSEILYNPVRDSLLLARGDGHFSLGVYEAPVPRRKGSRVSAALVDGFRPLKGALGLDAACFSSHRGWGGSPGLACYDAATLRRFYSAESRGAVDGWPLRHYRSGPVFHLGTYVYVAHRGGVTLFDPLGGGSPRTYRLLDFPGSTYGPLRVNAEPALGGYLVPFTHSAATIKGGDYPEEIYVEARRLSAPTLLVYFYHRGVRVAGVAGYRVTSLTSRGGLLAVAWNTEPNLERLDLTLSEHGEKGITILSLESLLESRPPPLRISYSPRPGDAFGGLPLEGYLRVEAVLKGCPGGTLRVYYYDLASEAPEAEVYRVEGGGALRISLDAGGGLASFLVEGCRDPRFTVTAR